MANAQYDKDIYDKLVEGFTKFPGNYAKAAIWAGVEVRTAKRYFHGTGKTGARWPWFKPIEEVIREKEEAARIEAQRREEVLSAERDRLAEEAKKARALEEEAKSIDDMALRALRKDTLAGLVACATLTDGIQKLAIRIGNQLATGVDAQGNALNIDVSKALRTMRDYSLTVGRLGQIVEVIASMERVKNNLPTAIVGIDVSHVTLEDAEREVAFAEKALKRARELGLTVVDGGADKKAG